MAQVKLGQFLRRATTTLGEISATQPLETRLYGPSGEVLRTVSLSSGERGLAVVPYASDGGELFSAAKPGQVALTGRTAVLTTLVSAQAITDTTIRNVTFDASPYRQIDFIIRNSLDSQVAIGFRMPDSSWLYIIDDDGAIFAYTPDPESPSNRWHRVPSRAGTGGSRYFMLSQIPLNDGKFKAPFRDYLFTADIRYRAVNTPTEGSLSIILVGVPN